MESQVSKSKISNDAKDETEKKRKGFLKKDSFRNVKESLEENDVIIINNVQDLEKDMKNFVEKMEKQLLTHHSLISTQRLKFREILSKFYFFSEAKISLKNPKNFNICRVSLILDHKDVNYEKFHHFFKNLNISYLLASQKSLKGSDINLDTLDFLKDISDPTKPNGQNTKNAVLVESDTSHKNTKIHVKETIDHKTSEKKSIEKKNVKREREDEASNENAAKIQKKRKTNKNSNGTQPIEATLIEETTQNINQNENIGNKNAQNHQQNMTYHNNNMAAMNNNYKFMNNFNHFMPNPGFENANMLAQKMMTSNGNFIQYNDVINNKNMLSMNKN